jgi:hypothetical protein
MSPDGSNLILMLPVSLEEEAEVADFSIFSDFSELFSFLIEVIVEVDFD